MRRIITILIFIIGSTAVRSQGLTFAVAERMMLDNNLEIKGARQALTIAQAELRAMRGLRYPSVDLVGGYVYMQRDVSIELGGTKGALSDAAQHIINKGVSSGIISSDVALLISEGISPLLTTNLSYTLQKRSTMLGAVSLMQPIYMGGRISAAITSAEIGMESARRLLDATIGRKRSELVDYYYGVMLAKRAVEVRQRAVEGIRLHLSDAEAMEQEGLIAQSEVLYVRYKLSEAERNLHDAESKLALAHEALRRLIGEDIAQMPVDRIFVVDVIYPLDFYVQSAVNLNPILLDVKSKIALSEQGVRVARGELLPEVALFGAATIASHNLSDLLPRWNIGIGVRIKLFDGLGKERRYVAAKQTKVAAHIATADAESAVRLLVEKEYYNTINSLYDVGNMRATIEFARSYLEAKSEGFREGVVPSSEVVDAQLELLTAELEQLASAFTFCKSLALLLEASGLSDTLEEYRQKAIFL